MAEVLPKNERTTKILKKREQEAEEKKRLEDQVSLLVYFTLTSDSDLTSQTLFLMKFKNDLSNHLLLFLVESASQQSRKRKAQKAAKGGKRQGK